MSDDSKPEASGLAVAKSVWITSIVTSLIGSAIFLLFFQPILEAGSKVTISVLSSLGGGILDSIYTQASIGYLEPVVFGSQMMFALFVVNISFVPVIAKIASNRAREAEENKDIETDNKSNLICKFCESTAYILPFAALVCSAYIMSSSYICVQANASFNSYMRASLPFLTEQQEEIFWSKWALMDSREEYTALMNEFEARAKSGGWKLPARLI